MSTYTGKIHHKNHGDDIHTVAAIFYNKSQDNTFHCDEKDLHDYIGISTGETQKMHIQAMRGLQSYKQEHGIELSYHPVDEWAQIDKNNVLGLD